ncbi:MAG: urease accessory UreF family protein [Litorilinea sp.]
MPTSVGTGQEDRLLDLLHLADSALPIGAQSHSFGLETLTASGMVTSANLEAFLRDYIEEVIVVDCVYCRAAYALGADLAQTAPDPTPDPTRHTELLADWLALNRRLGALRTAQETRVAGEVLGRRFLALAAEASGNTALRAALDAAQQAGVACHHAPAFGLVGGALGLEADATTAAFAQQALAALCAAAQKLLPVGQSAVTHMRWRLKPALHAALAQSHAIPLADVVADVAAITVASFAPQVELASMRHPALPVRLFIS